MCGPFLRAMYSCLLLTVVLTEAAAQTCERLDPVLFPSCVNIGHNQTFKLPSYVDKKLISRFLNSSNEYSLNCSTSPNAPTAVDCAIFLPLCVEGRSTPLSPCRRVCAEAVLGCSNTMSTHALEYSAAWCNVLPNSTAASGECFEPSNFTLTVNRDDFSSMGKCHERLIPMCGDQGYSHTILSNKSQASILKFFYNTTADFASLNASDYSFPPILETEIKKYPKCEAAIRKMFCVFFLPPCYLGETKRYYSLCQSDCTSISSDCPDFWRHYPEDLEACADFPDSSYAHGFCAHTSWPKSTPLWFRKRAKPVAPTKDSKINPGIIAAATIVPVVVLIIVAVAAVFLWRRYSVTLIAYRKHRDDVTSIVTE